MLAFCLCLIQVQSFLVVKQRQHQFQPAHIGATSSGLSLRLRGRNQWWSFEYLRKKTTFPPLKSSGLLLSSWLPDISVLDDENNNGMTAEIHSLGNLSSPRSASSKRKDESSRGERKSSTWTNASKKYRRGAQASDASSWMDRNHDFMTELHAEEKILQRDRSPRTIGNDKHTQNVNYADKSRRSSLDNEEHDNNEIKSFREDFRGTRVFVQNIPLHVTWQKLKDHFRIAGEVVFASISVDRETGLSTGNGIVQFETTEGARTAIKIMRDHPLEDSTLFVRADVQETDRTSSRGLSLDGRLGPSSPSTWKCADEDVLAEMDPESYQAIQSLINARDSARRRKNFAASDRIRDELKCQHGVHVDDRLRMWWVSSDGKRVPPAVSTLKGDGRWGNLKPWRHIPTTDENDACVSIDLVEGLLRQRDIARREKDFKTADKLLEQARTSPDGDLTLRIHDESRTWRVWTDSPPTDSQKRRSSDERISTLRARGNDRNSEKRPSALDQCIALVERKAPHKVEQICEMLKRFPEREAMILQKLQERYDGD